MYYLKKIFFSLFTLCFFYTSYSQNIFEESYTIYETSSIKKEDSSPIFISKTNDGGLISVFAKPKGESKSYYSVYYYNQQGKLVKTSFFKTENANKIYLSNNQLHLIRYKKKTIDEVEDDGYGGVIGFPKFSKTEFYIQSSLLNELNFGTEYKLWSSIEKEDNNWSDNTEACNISFDSNKEKDRLLSLTTIHYNSYNTENSDAAINIKASDDLKRTKKFSTSFYFNFMDKDLQSIFQKKIIATNNYGEFEILKKIVTNESAYLLINSFDRKRTKSRFSNKKIHHNHYHLLKVDKNGYQFKSLDDVFQYGASAIDLNFFKDQIFITSMYSVKFNNNIDGFYKITLDKDTFNKIDTHYFTFSNDFLEDVKAPMDYKNSKFPNKNVEIKSNNYRTLKLLRSHKLFIDSEGNSHIIIEEYDIIESGGGVPMMGMPGIGGGMVSIAMSINYSSSSERQIGFIGAKISADNKLVWSRRIKNKEKRNTFYETVNADNTIYIIKKHTPKTHKLYNQADAKNKKQRYYYALSFDENGQINSSRFSPYYKHTTCNFTKGNDDHIYMIDDKVSKFIIKRLNLKK